jgi:hypothetical protein
VAGGVVSGGVVSGAGVASRSGVLVVVPLGAEETGVDVVVVVSVSIDAASRGPRAFSPGAAGVPVTGSSAVDWTTPAPRPSASTPAPDSAAARRTRPEGVRAAGSVEGVDDGREGVTPPWCSAVALDA